MKRLLILLALVFSGITMASAQDEAYREKTKEMIQLSKGSYDPENIEKIFKTTINATMGAIAANVPEEQSDTVQKILTAVDNAIVQVVVPYLQSEEFLDDVANVMAANMQKEFTLKEMDKLVAIYRDPKLQEIQKKGGRLSLDYSQVYETLIDNVFKISMGNEPAPIEKVDCPEAYRKAFDKYFKPIKELLDEQMSAKMKDAINAMPSTQNLADYISESIPETCLRSIYPTITIDELKYMSKTTNNKLVIRAMKANADTSNEAMSGVVQKLMGKVMQSVQL